MVIGDDDDVLPVKWMSLPAQSNCGGRSVRVWGRCVASGLTSTASPSSVRRKASCELFVGLFTQFIITSVISLFLPGSVTTGRMMSCY